MDGDQLRSVRDVFQFLAELRENGLTEPEILRAIDDLLRGDALIDSEREIYLDAQQGKPFVVSDQSKDRLSRNGHSKSEPKSKKGPLVITGDRQILFFFVMRMREAEEHERLAEAKGNKFEAYGWSCRARAYEEVCTELKIRGFGRK